MFSLYPYRIIMKDKKPEKSKRKLAYTLLVTVIMVIAALTIAFGSSHAENKLVAIGTAGTLIPTGVSNTLNVTFSDMNYITQTPQLKVLNGQYSGATYVKGTGGNFVNDSYLVMNSTGSAVASTLAGSLYYNYSKDKGTPAYQFTESRLAYNGTGTEYYGLSEKSLSAVPTLGSTTAGSHANFIGAFTEIANGVPSIVYALSTADGGTNGTIAFSTVTLSSLNFYLFSIYVTNTTISAGIYNTANGSLLASASLGSLSASPLVQNLNITELQYVEPATLNAQAGFILDWMYVATHNTFANSPLISPGIATYSPMITGSSSDFNSLEPFDPNSTANTTFNQAPNATSIHVNTNVGGSDFASVIASSNTTTTHALLLNTSQAVTSFTKIHNLTSTQGFQTFATLNQTNTVINANIHVAVWNSSGINNAIISFLKNYSAIKAGVPYNQVTIMGFTIGSMQLVTNLSAADATAVRDYMDNSIASLMSSNNVSLVDTNTTTIVAGAFAGDFYWEGMAVVPEVHNGMITNPFTGLTFANLTDAGFATGAYISGGVVVVPQWKILSFSGGVPIFASEGFSFGSLFSSLTSGGSAVAHFLSNGATSIANGIGKVVSTGTNYVAKTIDGIGKVVSTGTTDLKTFTNDVSQAANSVVPTLGAISGDVSKEISGALGPIAGSVSKISDTLGSIGQGIVTSVAAGYSGLKTNIMKLGNSTSNALSDIQNTLGKSISQSSAVLSEMYTAMSNIPNVIKTDVQSLSTGIHNSLNTVISSIMNTAGTFYSKVTGGLNATESVFGKITNGIAGGINSIKTGLGNTWSMITSFGAKLGYVLEIVGITIAVVVVVGIVLYLVVFRRPSIGVPGEKSI